MSAVSLSREAGSELKVNSVAMLLRSEKVSLSFTAGSELKAQDWDHGAWYVLRFTHAFAWV
jgi:hypothetical protein